MTVQSGDGKKWILHHKIGLVQDTLAETVVSWETKKKVNDLIEKAGVHLHSGQVEKGIETIERARSLLL